MPHPSTMPDPSSTTEASPAGAPSLADVLDKYESGAEDDTASIVAVGRGMKEESFNLYEGPPKCTCCVNWVEEYPDDVQVSIEAVEGTQEYAILLRNKKSHDGGTAPLKLDSVVVRSPLIKGVLDEKVLKGYPGVCCSLEDLVFSSPFAPFVHRWEAFEKTVEEEQDPETRRHLMLLYDAIKTDTKETLARVSDLLTNGVITYDLVWTMFMPGNTVFYPRDKLFFRLQSTGTTIYSGFELALQGIAYDGDQLGYRTKTITIEPYDGTTKILELPAYPLKYLTNADECKAYCTRRAGRYLDLRGVHTKVLRKPPFQASDKFSTEPTSQSKLRERVVVDAWLFYDKEECIDLDDLDDEHKSSEGDLNAEGLLLVESSVKAFSLKGKKWNTVHVDIIEDINWNENVFDNLVLGSDHKELVLGFVESHRILEDEVDDFVEGKGRSLLFLLSGPPGVGKTLTAEAVSEKLHAPLYTISAGELGITPSGVEEALQSALDLAKRWNAVLLLDEADVFLEQRTIHDLARNQLVSVFLRLLEYYEGVLFLTTNRVHEIDLAIQSRIDVHLAYADLDVSSRIQVWKNFLANSTKKTDISDEGIRKVAEAKMNGRQIKSVFKQANLLAARSKEKKLELEHVRRVLKVMKIDTAE
ncbi:hypothetical protein GGR56DRAFT_661241 [Xylariaceae sp. FL0804]|nr:hypothetical protein GGR56DRAFT_661241 [Xylariaceae sp. FL0804]